MKPKYLSIPLAAAALLCGCGPKSSPDAPVPAQTNAAAPNGSAAEVKAAVRQTVDASQAYATQSKNEFVATLDRKLEACDQKAVELGRKLETLNDGAKAEGAKAIESWREQRGQLGQKLDELKKSGQEAGQDIKAGFESAVAELEKAFENIKSRFKG